MTDLRYPIGRHDPRAPVEPAQVAAAVAEIAGLPDALRRAVEDLDAAQLATPYREGGWTVAQVVHHLADSHVNASTRLRLAMTEESPTIRPYDERAWAELPDAVGVPIAPSLAILEGLHARWAALLRTLGAGDFERRLVHPDIGPLSVGQLTCLYGWHSRHHVAHIAKLRARSGW